MAIFNVFTARNFKDRKNVCEWITESRKKAYELSEGVMRR